MKRFDWRSNMFICALAKNDISCVALNVFQPVHLITVDVNEQKVAVVQPTENKRTNQLSSGFRRQEMADRANSSDLEMYWTTDVVTIDSSVNVDPEMFDMTFEGTIIIASSQVVIVWHAGYRG